MTNRRDFLALGTGACGALALSPGSLFASEAARQAALGEWLRTTLPGADTSPDALADDERFWAGVRRGYSLDPKLVNLDHGWTNPPPREAVDALVRGARDVELLPADRLPRYWDETTNTTVRAAIAEVMGVPGTELALVRNATEALDTVLLGVPLQRGDEVVCSAHDYYAMLDALDQRQARDGVVLRMLRPPVPAPSMDALAEMYEAAIGPRTRLVLLTNPSNLTGQLLPVRRIADAAHAAGAEVAVDGAQSLGLVRDPVTSLECDYYGASLHKWLGAPVGMGVLWMRPAHVAKVWPLLPPGPGTTGMSRFEWIGTNPEYVGPALLPALQVQQRLGAERKVARLRYLARYWRTRAAGALPGARFYTDDGETTSCGLCVVEIPGADSTAIQKRLRERHGVLVQAMSGARAPEIRGIRVTPNVYTSLGELDRFLEGLVESAKAGG
ncbi:MAG TPA: aminotransferase class V-fold PLP-dependent enzyme, partial [Gemmatimonadales bacterium]|nr:aminotransferase class V-fold PLP-dependent enzyme [Gemmatimonadales bacterium]